MKKLIALLLVLVFAFTMVGCGNSGGDTGGDAGGGTTSGGTTGGDAGGEVASYDIGFNTWGAGSATFETMGEYISNTIELAGSTSSWLSDDFLAEKELQNIQNFVAAEVDGIVMQTTADPVLPQAAELCAAAEIPFVLGIFVGNDADRAKVSAENKYYVGACNADLIQDGYVMGKAAAEAGYKKAVLLGGNVGDNHMDQRHDGFVKGFVDEGGGVVLEEVRCNTAAEAQEKANAALAANPDADCVFAMVSDYVLPAIGAMETLEMDLPIFCCNANSDCVAYILDGTVEAAAGGNDLAACISAALLINYLDGHPILDANGKAPELKTTPFSVNADNVELFQEICFDTGGAPFAQHVLNTLCWRNNPDVTYDDFVEFINSGMTLEAIEAASK